MPPGRQTPRARHGHTDRYAVSRHGPIALLIGDDCRFVRRVQRAREFQQLGESDGQGRAACAYLEVQTAIAAEVRWGRGEAVQRQHACADVPVLDDAGGRAPAKAIAAGCASASKIRSALEGSLIQVASYFRNRLKMNPVIHTKCTDIPNFKIRSPNS